MSLEHKNAPDMALSVTKMPPHPSDSFTPKLLYQLPPYSHAASRLTVRILKRCEDQLQGHVNALPVLRMGDQGSDNVVLEGALSCFKTGENEI